MPNTDEKRAKVIIINAFPNLNIEFKQKWAKFLAEKSRMDKPQKIADEFISRWGEL